MVYYSRNAKIAVTVIVVIVVAAIAVLVPGFIAISKCGSFAAGYTGCLAPATVTAFSGASNCNQCPDGWASGLTADGQPDGVCFKTYGDSPKECPPGYEFAAKNSYSQCADCGCIAIGSTCPGVAPNNMCLC